MEISRIALINKATHARVEVTGPEVVLPAQAIVELPVPWSQIKSAARSGDNLVLTTADGQVIVVQGYFTDWPGGHSELVAQAEPAVGAHGVLLADAGDAAGSSAFAESVLPDSAAAASSASDAPVLTDALASADTDASAGAGTDAGGAVAGVTGAGVLDALPLVLGGLGIAAVAIGSRHSSAADTSAVVPTIDSISQNDDGTLTVRGQAQPGDTVTATYPNGSVSTAAVDASGNYTAKSSAAQNAGDVTVTDTSGAGTVSQHWDDTTPPQAPVVALANDTGDDPNDGITNDGTLTLSGIEDSAKVEYSTDGVTWSATAPVWAQGSNTVYVRQTDAAGNVSDPSQPLTFTYDTSLSDSAQGVMIGWIDPDTSRDPQTWEFPPLGRDFITHAQNLTVGAMIPGANTIGPLSPDERVQINLGDGFWHDTVAVPPDLSPVQYFEYDATGVTLDQGTYTFEVRVIDTAGNTTASQSQVVVIDTARPDALGVALANDTGISNSDGITSDGTLALSGIEDGARVEYKYSVDGETVRSTSFTPVEGENTVQVRQVDVAGNASEVSSITFTLDTTRPDAPVVALANDTGDDPSDGITNDGTLTLNGVEDGAKVEYSADGITWSATAPVWAQGSDTVYVRQTDAAGNVSDPSQPLTFTYDTSLSESAQDVKIGWIYPDTSRDPQTWIFPPLGGEFVTKVQHLTVGAMIPDANTIGPLSPDERVQINLGDGIWHDTAAVPPDLSPVQYFQYDATGVTLDQGTYTFEVRVIDTAGNTTASQSQVVVIDTTAPTETVTMNDGVHPSGITGGLSYAITGTLGSALADGSQPGVSAESVQVSLNGGQTWNGATDASGTAWEYAFANMLPDGLHIVEARVADAAGNVGQQVAVQQVAVSASGTLNLSLQDILSDAQALTGAGSTQQVTVNGGGVVSTVHLTDGIGTGAGQWQDTGTATVNGVLYDVYHNAAQGASTVADLLIEHGIGVI